MSCDSTLRGARNADLTRTYAVTSQGVAFDLTGWTAFLNIYSAPGSAPLLALSGSPTAGQSSIIIASAAAGLVTLIVTRADMESLPLGSPTTSPSALVYDLLLTDPDDQTTRFTFGQFIVDPVGGGAWCQDQGDQLSLDIGSSSIQIDIFGGAPVIDGSTLTGAEIGALALQNGAASQIFVVRDRMPTIFDFAGSATVGDGTTSASGALAALISSGLRACHWPDYIPGSGTLAAYVHDANQIIPDNFTMRGGAGKSKIIQGDLQAFTLRGNNISVRDLIVDQSRVTSSAHSLIRLDTASQNLINLRFSNIVAGLDRDDATLMAGYTLFDDGNGAFSVIDTQWTDIQVFAAKATPFLFTDLLAEIFFTRCLADFTRQAAAPSYPGFSITGGEGIFLEDCNVQGIGTGSTGNAGAHGYVISNAAAVDLTGCRADTLGGIGFKITNVSDSLSGSLVASLCGAGGIALNGCAAVDLSDIYTGGRSGQSWAPTATDNLTINNCPNFRITGLRSIEATGNGVTVTSAVQGRITAAQILFNAGYGLNEGAGSDFNVFSALTTILNGTNNGFLTGTHSRVVDLMPNSGNWLASIAATGAF